MTAAAVPIFSGTLSLPCFARNTFNTLLRLVLIGIYRLMANRMRGYDDAQARQIFRDLIDMSADVAITHKEVTVRFHSLTVSGLSDSFDSTFPRQSSGNMEFP
jgi:hypothetical protein